MKTIVTKGIVLTRTNFQEADRIVTLLTPDHGKIRVLAKGVRKSKSKLAGGIELFSVADITVLPGKGDIGTLISTRLDTHFGNIVRDINRTMYGYELLKRTNRVTEEAAERGYFDLLHGGLKGLDNSELSVNLNDLWFSMQLLKLTGHAPNLRTDVAGNKLEAGQEYVFDTESMAFTPKVDGGAGADMIKVLRLAYAVSSPERLHNVAGAEKEAERALRAVKGMTQLHLAI